MKNFFRREFFRKNIPTPKSSESFLLPETTSETVGQRTLSRRSFIKFLSAMGTAFAIESIDVDAVNAKEKQDNKEVMQEIRKDIGQQSGSESFFGNNIETKITEKKDNSYAETALEQGLVASAKLLAKFILRKLKIEHGNKSLSEEKILKYLKEKPIESLIEIGFLGPVFEESVFRALPSGFIDSKDKSCRWDVGIPVSAIFALVHNFDKNEFGNLKFEKSIPLSQFMGGLFYWYLMREKGYSHAVLAHLMNNTMAVSVGVLLFKIFPGEEAERIVKNIL